MNIEEARRNKMLQDLRQSLNELVAAHNTLFEQTGEDTRLFWAKFSSLEKDIESLRKDTASLKRSVSEQSRQVGDLYRKEKEISERVLDIEQRQKDSEADIKRLDSDLASYQVGCGRTIAEFLIRLARLESRKI